MSESARIDETTGSHGIILFDGVCGFCNSTVNFVIERAAPSYYKFAPLQSNAGKVLLGKYFTDADKINSFVLIENGAAYIKSTAALRVARQLGGFYSLLYVFIVVPHVLRDVFYDALAKNRYRLFGKKDSCALPTSELRQRFL